MTASKNKQSDVSEIIEDAEVELSSLEEAFLRVRHGISASDQPLQKKTRDPKLLARLLELERNIIQRAQKLAKK